MIQHIDPIHKIIFKKKSSTFKTWTLYLKLTDKFLGLDYRALSVSGFFLSYQKNWPSVQNSWELF